MEEIEVDPIESSPKDESYDNLLSSYDFSSLGHENGDDHLRTKEFSCRIIQNNDEEEEEEEDLQLVGSNDEPQKIVHKFYFVKIRSSYVDPMLTSKIEHATELWKYMINVKAKISNEIKIIKRKIYSARDKMVWARNQRQKKYYAKSIRANIRYWQQQLDQIQWSDDEDLSAEPQPESEPINNIDEKIQILRNQLGHGSMNLAKERKTLRELKEMQRRKEQTTSRRIERKKYCAKQGVQRHISAGLAQLRDLEVQDRKATELYEQKKAEIQKEIIPYQKKLDAIHQKIGWAKDCIVRAKLQLYEQTAYYDEQIAMLSNAQELAVKKDLVALEELSYKQVEQFMSLWNSSDAFRANYTRSVMLSFENRRLSNDGRMLNADEQHTRRQTKFV